jgi:hypothetical protein
VTRYRIVPERSQLWIEATSSVHPIHSRSDGLEGHFELDTAPDGTPVFGVPPVGQISLAVKRLRAGNPLEHRELQRRIEARRHPTIDGTVTAAERIEGTARWAVTGELTFRGVARECKDEVTIEAVDDRTVRLAGESTFDVRDFGMEPPRILLLRVDPMVAVRIEVIAEADG